MRFISFRTTYLHNLRFGFALNIITLNFDKYAVLSMWKLCVSMCSNEGA